MVGDASQVHDWQLDRTGEKPDVVIPIEPGSDFEALAMLRLMLRGRTVPDAPQVLRDLLSRMLNARYGVVFFGLGITETSMWDGRPHSPIGHNNVAALLQLVADLNTFTRFTARRMRIQGDVSGADNVLCWQTGYPFAVDMSRGYPRYNPGEFSANELLAHGDTDLCLLVGAETVPSFSDAAKNHLRSIPTIVLDYPGASLDWVPTVRFTTSVYGLNAGGTIYRMDNVPIELKALQPCDTPTDEEVLTQLRQHC
jgi:formylmethanofuran dehydrogenase subunit B